MAAATIEWSHATHLRGQNTAETHCCICLNPENEGILAHFNGSELIHRVHRTCLLAFERNVCPVCIRPYDRDQVPLPLISSFEGVARRILYWMNNVGENCAFYMIGCVSIVTCSVVILIMTPLFPHPWGLLSSSYNLPVYGLYTATIHCLRMTLVGDGLIFAGRHLIDWINPENSTTKKVIQATTFIFILIGAGIATYLFASSWVSSLLESLTKETLTATKLLLDNGLGNPLIQEEIRNWSLPLAEKALTAYLRITGIYFGSVSAVSGFFLRKACLISENRSLDGWS